MKTNRQRIQKDIESIAAFNATPGQGLTRWTYTKEHRGAADYIMEQMRLCGLAVREDAVGTIIGRMEGSDPHAPAVMVGSHFDSVRCGGNFDGPAGVVAGLETARVLHESGFVPACPIEFVAMVEEEGARFGGGLFASRAMVGKLGQEELRTFRDKDGISTGEAMKAFGLDPEKFADARRSPAEIKAFVELHIEQGPILEAEQMDVGIVETIVGIKEVEFTVTGRPDHAGTTPMDMRADAFLAACRMAQAANAFAIAEGNGTVATVGKVDVAPGSFNIVPGKVVFYVDIRSKKQECIDSVYTQLIALGKEIEESRDGVGVSHRMMIDVAPVDMDEKIRGLLTDSATALSLKHKSMLSGAGHDAMVMSAIAPVALLFVPSKGGRSHCPEEWTDFDQLQKGIETVCTTIRLLAK